MINVAVYIAILSAMLVLLSNIPLLVLNSNYLMAFGEFGKALSFADRFLPVHEFLSILLTVGSILLGYVLWKLATKIVATSSGWT